MECGTDPPAALHAGRLGGEIGNIAITLFLHVKQHVSSGGPRDQPLRQSSESHLQELDGRTRQCGFSLEGDGVVIAKRPSQRQSKGEPTSVYRPQSPVFRHAAADALQHPKTSKSCVVHISFKRPMISSRPHKPWDMSGLAARAFQLSFRWSAIGPDTT